MYVHRRRVSYTYTFLLSYETLPARDTKHRCQTSERKKLSGIRIHS